MDSTKAAASGLEAMEAGQDTLPGAGGAGSAPATSGARSVLKKFPPTQEVGEIAHDRCNFEGHIPTHSRYPVKSGTSTLCTFPNRGFFSGLLGAVGKSPWRMSHSPVVHEALSNAYWRKSGLRSIAERYRELR